MGSPLWWAIGIVGLVLSGAMAQERLDLEACYRIALERNPQLRAAKEQAEGARARVEQAEAAQGFSLNARYTQTRLGPEVSFQPAPGAPRFTVVPGSRSDATFTLQRVLYGEALDHSERAARWGYEASRQNEEQVRQEVLLRVRSAYLNLLKAERLWEVAQQSLEQTRAHLKVAQAMFEAGVVARFDVLRAEVEVQNAEERLLQAENGVALAKAALNNAMGLPPESPLEVEPLTGELRPTPTYEESLEQAYRQRPELAALKAQWQAAQEQVRAARAGQRPTLLLNANYIRQTSTAFARNFSWNASLVVNWNLFDSGQVRSQVEQAEALVRQLEETMEQVRQGIALEVRQAVLNLETARKRVETTRKAVEQAEEAFRVAQLRYREGAGTSVEMTDAQVALTAARTSAVNALYDYELAWAQWEKAVGIAPWAPPALEPPPPPPQAQPMPAKESPPPPRALRPRGERRSAP